MDYKDILEKEPYGPARDEKRELLTARLKELTQSHSDNCEQYKRMLTALDYDPEKVTGPEDIPFLPVRMFKERELASVHKEDIYKTMTSSGTSGQQVSKIYLNRETAANQQKTMTRIVSDFTGGGRMPMIIIDCPSVVKNRAMFSARGAGILGFSIFGRDKIYALDDDMNLQTDAIKEFMEKHVGEDILLFGFTFMIWQHFYRQLKDKGICLDIPGGILIHGGGWKKLVQEQVDPATFNAEIRSVCGNIKVSNYYGMVEQTGSIYMECECGHLHASTYSDIITRRYKDFSVCDTGEEGIIETISLLPESYPGHALLTDDKGVVLGEDDCPCGRKGKYFKINGRLKNAELRGCSDTYAAKF